MLSRYRDCKHCVKHCNSFDRDEDEIVAVETEFVTIGEKSQIKYENRDKIPSHLKNKTDEIYHPHKDSVDLDDIVVLDTEFVTIEENSQINYEKRDTKENSNKESRQNENINGTNKTKDKQSEPVCEEMKDKNYLRIVRKGSKFFRETVKEENIPKDDHFLNLDMITNVVKEDLQTFCIFLTYLIHLHLIIYIFLMFLMNSDSSWNNSAVFLIIFRLSGIFNLIMTLLYFLLIFNE